ncbi:MAG: hypothetical protein A2792_00135 [Sphingomonadales bacterium RIFCSPHIGHO2_01_FULL_65_20]|nr:MAG: hypothetical protein A2792_00135 [Sphingomonadales bacterium RIFCSPHIGHO2_01_FULL_65_20]
MTDPKSILFGGARPDLFDGSILLPAIDFEQDGTIWAYQPSHAEFGQEALPVHGGPARNAACRRAARALGLDVSLLGDLHGDWVFGSNAGAGRILMEFTDRDALHMMVTQAGLADHNTYAFARIPARLRQHIYDFSVLGGPDALNPALPQNGDANHRFMMVLTARPTRNYVSTGGFFGQNCRIAGLANTTTVTSSPHYFSMTGSTTTVNYPVIGNEPVFPSTTSSALIGADNYPALPWTVGVPITRQAIGRGWFSAMPANAAAILGFMGCGHLPGNTSGNVQDAAPSYIVYDWRIIDTMLCEPWGEMHRLGNLVPQDLSHKHGDLFRLRDGHRAAHDFAFGPSGHWAGDSWSDPAIALP